MRSKTVTMAVALAAWMLTATGVLAPADAESQSALAKIEPSYVCMMNDKRFPEPQIPVEVEGRTYYGCCAMCKERLSQDAAARTAVDPVSGKTVDKATAVIGAAPDGRVFYFESETNLAQFTPAAAR
jgi:YHS domain-containing protein